MGANVMGEPREETYYHAIITYLYPTPYLGSFDHTAFPDMYEVRYTDWIESECSVYQFSSIMSTLAVPERYTSGMSNGMNRTPCISSLEALLSPLLLLNNTFPWRLLHVDQLLISSGPLLISLLIISPPFLSSRHERLEEGKERLT